MFSKKWRIAILLSLAVLVLGYRATAVYMVYVSPDLQSRIPFGARLDDEHLVVKTVDYGAAGFAGRPRDTLPLVGDRILEVYDARGRGGRVDGLFAWGAYLRPIDTKASWTMVVDRPRKGAAPERLTLKMPPAIPFARTWYEWVVDVGFDVYLPLLAMVAGLLIGLLRPRDDQAFLAALAFIGFSLSFRQRVYQFPAGWRELGLFLRTTAAYFTPYLLLRFFLKFPVQSVIDRRLPWIQPLSFPVIALAWVVGLSIEFAAHMSLRAHHTFHVVFEQVGFDVDRFGRVFTAVAVATVLVGLLAAVLNAVKATTLDERRRMSLIAAGAAIGLLPAVVLSTLGDQGVKLPQGLLAASIPLIGVFPLSFVYAVVRHRVFGIRLILRRGLQYALVSRGFLVVEGVAIFAALFFGAVPLLDRLDLETDPKLASAGIAIATLGLLRGVRRVNQRVLPAIDRRFFREAYSGQQILRELSRAVRTMASRPDQLLERVACEIDAALHPSSVAILLAEGPWPHLRPAGDPDAPCWVGKVSGSRQRYYSHYLRSSRPDGPEPRVPGGCRLSARLPLARHLELSVRDPDTLEIAPLQIFEGPERTDRTGWTDDATPCVEDRVLFEELDARLIVPLVTGGRPLGFLVLGEKLSEEPYSAENKDLLLTVAEQMAIALDYSQLIGQVAEQEALKRELQIAQQVQARLFPQEQPPLATLRYDGVCRAARGVAGDYYDFLPLGDGRVGLVVADIAGKGLPAALLMASLQALLRSHAATHAHDPGELAREVNRHLCQSSDEAKYATLFFGVYDDAARSLTFLNAGHPPPILIRGATGGGDPFVVERLEPGGTVLGLFPDQTYQKQSVALRPGDLLLVYSDGATEAADEGGDQFGVERLVDLVARHPEAEPAELTRLVLDEVDRFAGGARHDDVTLIVARAC